MEKIVLVKKKMKTKIFLTGFRGSGKTTLARLLAEALGFQLIEMDKLIVKKAGKSIAEITEDGKEWRGFRRLENRVLKELLKKDKIVAATGGGLFVNDIEHSKGLTFGEHNYNLVKNLPEKLIIFLKVNEEILKKRLSQPESKDYNKNFRPSLSGFKIGIEEEIKIYRKRLPLYELRSDLIIDISKQIPEESVNEILKSIR